MSELNILSVEWRNFMGYGDYVTKIELDGLGPTLIEGKNRAGKTTIVEVMVWVLFGRTTFKDRPADRVINDYIKEGCYGELKLGDGTTVRRTRKLNGHSDLIIHSADGEDISSGTNPKAQEIFQKKYNLDFLIFTSSGFFGQFGTSFLELTSAKSRGALERIMHVAHTGVYAETAKGKRDAAELEQSKVKGRIELIETELTKLNGQIERNRDLETGFESKREQKIRTIKAEIIEAEEEHDRKVNRVNKRIKETEEAIEELTPIDLTALTKRWNTITKIHAAIKQKENERRDKESDLRIFNADLMRIKNEIKELDRQAGKICPKCKQEIKKSHIEEQANPKKEEVEKTNQDIEVTNKKIEELKKIIETAEEKVKAAEPEHTIEGANRIISDGKRLKNELKNLASQIKELDEEKEKNIKKIEIRVKDAKNEKNPYGAEIGRLQKDTEKAGSDKEKLSSQISKLDILIRHIEYIRSAYHDKKKIKAFILSSLVPFLNRRIAYYLEAFNLDCTLKFDAFLQRHMSGWDYEFRSGGERKRIDLSVMFALHDLHEAIYGRQCNLLVFDEVDGRLDEEGIHDFLDVLSTNFIAKDENRPILVVSHKEEMRDAFPTKISVVKRDNFSYIEEIR